MKSLQNLSKDELNSKIKKLRDNRWADLCPIKSAFAYAWIETFNHVEAARAINKPGSGLRFLRDPLVRAFIADLKSAYEDRRIITEGFVADQLLNVMPKLTGEEPISIVDRGEEFEAHRFDGPTFIRSLELAGKLAGVIEKKELTVSGAPVMNMNITITGDKPQEKIINPAMDEIGVNDG